MADYRDLTGNYESDFGILREFMRSISNEINLGNMEGQVIDHTFTTTNAEAITHKLGHTPTAWKILDTDTAGTIHRDSWTATTISLVSSSSSQTVKIYVE